MRSSLAGRVAPSAPGFVLWWAGVAAAVLVAGAPAAQACGGFFCNSTSPVVQAAESIVFSVDRDPSTGKQSLEAHIQILYSGAADTFSWVVPVDQEPTLAAGTNQLFQALEPATRPHHQYLRADEGQCYGGGGTGGSGGAGGSGGGGSQDAGSADAGGSGGVVVSFRGDVGPYDAAVIKSDDPNALSMWLSDNNYFVSPAATKIIGQYVGEAKTFVALKLINGKTVQEITPIVLKFAGDTPCVPLRLTAIASQPSLGIRLWVVGQTRMVPTNFLEMQLNAVKVDWYGDRNWTQMLVDAATEAGGNAFAVEYAGTSTVMNGRLWSGSRYDLVRIRGANIPPDFIEALFSQGFPQDGALLGVLRTHVPLPDKLKVMGVSESMFWASNRYYWNNNKALFAPFDPAAAADDLDTAVLEPLRQAQSLFDRHIYMTRLATFITPEHMTLDPTFAFNGSLPDVPATQTARAALVCGANVYNTCTAPLRTIIPDGRTIWMRPLSSCGTSYGYDRSDLDKMPSLEVAWRRGADGDGTAVIDNRAAINAALDAHNAAVFKALPPPGNGGASGAGGGQGGQGGQRGTGGQSGTGGASGSGGAGGTSGPGDTASPLGSRSCGCSQSGPGGGPGLATSALALAVVAMRARRRRSGR